MSRLFAARDVKLVQGVDGGGGVVARGNVGDAEARNSEQRVAESVHVGRVLHVDGGDGVGCAVDEQKIARRLGDRPGQGSAASCSTGA